MVLAMNWLTASVWMAGFVCAFLTVAAWAAMRSAPARRGSTGSAEYDKLETGLSTQHTELLRSLEGLRAEVGELRSQVSDVQRLLREVG